MKGIETNKEIVSMLVRGLLAFGVSKNDAIQICLECSTEERANELMNWMADHPKVTPEDISALALVIHETDMKVHMNDC